MSPKNLVYAAIFAVLTAIGAQLRVPLFPVPITLQTLFVLLSGLTLGPVFGAVSQIIYLGMGLVGLPVFAGGGGISSILAPSFGYLVGFVPAAYLAGRLFKSSVKKSIGSFFLAAIAGTVAIYAVGVPYLYLNLKYIVGKDIGVYRALLYGCIIFLPGDIAKSIAAALLASKLYKRLQKR